MLLLQRVLVMSALFWLLVISGCGGSSSTPEADEDVGSAPASHSASPAGTPQERLDKAIRVATLHLKFKEYAEGEQVLQTALADAGVADKEKALLLLKHIKSERRENEPSAPEAAPTGSPTSSPVVSRIDEPVVSAKPDEPAVASRVVPVVPPTAPAAKAASAVPKSATTPAEARAESDGVKGGPVEVLIVEGKAVEEAPVEKTAATDVMLAKLEESARGELEATAALKLYERFVERHTLTAEQEQKLTPRQEKWKEQAAKGLVRNGTVWVTPEVARQNVAEAGSLIEQALALIKVNNVKAVRELLEKASKLDGNGIQADFILGLLNSGVGVNHPETAEKHFLLVLKRSPRHISALNNLALSEIKLGRFQQALVHFTMARDQAPRTPEINQNIGRLIKEASSKRLAVPDAMLARYSKLYTEMTASGKVQPSNSNKGWYYMPLYLPESERKGRADPTAARGGDTLVLCGSGSGFIIHPGYVLTNRHVVRDEDFGLVEGLTIVDPTDDKHERELPASVIAVSAEHDMAIVKCESIKASAVPLSTSLPRRGTEILALGYPKSDLIGRGLKATRGIVTSLPDAATDQMLMFDAEINGGNSGGPILDKSGQAIAVATARYNVAIVGNYSAGVPSTLAIPFVKTVLPDFETKPAPAIELNWPDVDAQVAPATVMLLCYRKTVAMNLNRTASTGATVRELEDVSCSVCNGTGKVRCRNKGCVGGLINSTVTVKGETVGGTFKNKISQNKTIQTDCPNCVKGLVECSHCTQGRDASLR